jgi:hypothetical protein
MLTVFSCAWSEEDELGKKVSINEAQEDKGCWWLGKGERDEGLISFCFWRGTGAEIGQRSAVNGIRRRIAGDGAHTTKPRSRPVQWKLKVEFLRSFSSSATRRTRRQMFTAPQTHHVQSASAKSDMAVKGRDSIQALTARVPLICTVQRLRQDVSSVTVLRSRFPARYLALQPSYRKAERCSRSLTLPSLRSAREGYISI